jgi:putative ABC transport system permease protein
MNLEVNDKIFSLLLYAMPDEQFVTMEETLYGMAPQIDATFDSVLKTLDDAEKASPAAINFYATDFESKEMIEQFINDYNDTFENKEDKLQYSDVVGALMSSVTTIVNVISYILIAFVAISLVVSSIMIGIITNISVLERTKEIGILRAVGASRKDISRVFNAETVIIGFCAGMIGVISTVLLCIPTSLIIRYLTGFDNLTAYVPLPAAIILVVISVLLTMIAGLIPVTSDLSCPFSTVIRYCSPFVVGNDIV